MSNLLEEVKSIEEGFASDAQRRAAFASGYKAKGKKGKKEEAELDEGMIDTLAKKYEKRITDGGALASDRRRERERHAILNVAKKKGASTADLKKLDAAIIKIIDRVTGFGEETELDEGKMKELATKIADVYIKMKKDSTMKPFADKFRADVKR